MSGTAAELHSSSDDEGGECSLDVPVCDKINKIMRDRVTETLETDCKVELVEDSGQETVETNKPRETVKMEHDVNWESDEETVESDQDVSKGHDGKMDRGAETLEKDHESRSSALSRLNQLLGKDRCTLASVAALVQQLHTTKLHLEQQVIAVQCNGSRDLNHIFDRA